MMEVESKTLAPTDTTQTQKLMYETVKDSMFCLLNFSPGANPMTRDVNEFLRMTSRMEQFETEVCHPRLPFNADV
jgi:hypothetical protein